jgi:hypothetical protein
MGQLGLHGITVAEEDGGLGLGYLEHVVAQEEVAGGGPPRGGGGPHDPRRSKHRNAQDHRVPTAASPKRIDRMQNMRTSALLKLFKLPITFSPVPLLFQRGFGLCFGSRPGDLH